MYCTSNEFLNRMHVCIDEIEEKSDGVLVFAEYIPLPYFGNTILRFDIKKETYTLADLDAYEAFMQDIVKDDFLVDFMGSVYQKVGFEPWMYDETFRKCYYKYNDVSIASGDNQEKLKTDALFLLNKCGLSADAKAWEIQIEEEIALFILGEANRKIGIYTLENNTIHVYEVDKIPCIGLMRASMYAKLQHISLVRVLLEV